MKSYTEPKGFAECWMQREIFYSAESFDACDFLWATAFQTVCSLAGNWNGISKSQDFPVGLYLLVTGAKVRTLHSKLYQNANICEMYMTQEALKLFQGSLI